MLTKTGSAGHLATMPQFATSSPPRWSERHTTKPSGSSTSQHSILAPSNSKFHFWDLEDSIAGPEMNLFSSRHGAPAHFTQAEVLPEQAAKSSPQGSLQGMEAAKGVSLPSDFRRQYYHSQSSDEETEAQKGQVTQPRVCLCLFINLPPIYWTNKAKMGTQNV